MIPTAAMNSGMERVEAIEPKASGYAVQTTVRTKISQTWLASQTGAIELCAWSRIRCALRAPAGKELPEAGAEVGAGEHGVEGEPDQGEEEREVVEVHGQPPAARSDVVEGSSSGARARRRRIQATPMPTPR